MKPTRTFRFFWLEQLLIPATIAVGLGLGVAQAVDSSLHPVDSTPTVVTND